MKISFSSKQKNENGTLIVFGFEKKKLTKTAQKFDAASKGALSRAIEGSRYTGKFGQKLELLAPAHCELSRIVLIGLGKPSAMSTLKAEKIGGKIITAFNAAGAETIDIAIDPPRGLGADVFAAHLAFGAKLKSYRFDKYRTTETEEKKPTLTGLNIICSKSNQAEKKLALLDHIAEGIIMARDLVTEPGNVIYPESYAEYIKELSQYGLEIEVLGEDAMEELGMGALLGVGQSSASESQLVIMRWNGAKKADQAPITFIGKGVTFDTGGISLKPGAGMEDMKFDMGGSATVVGLMRALAGRKAPVNAIGLVGLVENMPSSTAQRPGDVVTSMSGQTIEVINTDAEGRLVLADVLWYAKEKYKPCAMIDLATLTGAMIIALGHEHAGVFSNDDDLSHNLVTAGQKTGEGIWPMPLGSAYDKLIDSQIADMKNVGGREAGSITAAQFLQRYVGDVPWAHIDIAGTAWRKKADDITPAGATGYGIRLLNQLVVDHYEADE